MCVFLLRGVEVDKFVSVMRASHGWHDYWLFIAPEAKQLSDLQKNLIGFVMVVFAHNQ